MGYDIAYEIVNEATREVPEKILDNPELNKALGYLADVIAEYSDFINPNSEEMEMYEYQARREGAVETAEAFESALADALYRQKLFGEAFDLERFIDSMDKELIDG